MRTITPAQLSNLIAEFDIRSPIRSVTIEDDSVILRTAWEAFQVPFPSPVLTLTIPEPTAVSGPPADDPAFTQPEPVEADAVLTTDNCPPPTAVHTDNCPPPTAVHTDNCPPPTAVDTDHWPLPTASLDDFTVIDGVGPITAQKLHDLGLYTYEDLRNWAAALEDQDDIPAHTTARIVAWLQTYPF